MFPRLPPSLEILSRSQSAGAFGQQEDTVLTKRRVGSGNEIVRNHALRSYMT